MKSINDLDASFIYHISRSLFLFHKKACLGYGQPRWPTRFSKYGFASGRLCVHLMNFGSSTAGGQIPKRSASLVRTCREGIYIFEAISNEAEDSTV